MTTKSKSLLFIATTATPQREYRNEFLNAVAYPSGHLVYFRYRWRWISDECKEDLKSLRGQRALVVFCGNDGAGDFEFCPVRFATVLGAIPIDDQATIEPDDYITLQLILQEFAHLSSSTGFQSKAAFQRVVISNQDARPYPYQHGNDSSSKFVFFRELDSQFDLVGDRDWRRTANTLNQYRDLSDARFMHVRGIYELAGSWNTELQRKEVRSKRDLWGISYPLRYNKFYIVQLEYLHGNEDSMSIPVASPRLVSTSLPFRRYSPEVIESDVLLTATTPSDVHCALLCPGLEDENSPRALLHLSVQGYRSRVLLLGVLIALGMALQLFAGTLVDIAITLDPEARDPLVAVTKLTGVLCTTLGIVFGLRQMPSPNI